MIPVQKTGIDWPRKTTTVAAWSRRELRRTALRIPTGIATPRASSIASSVRVSVVDIRSSTRPSAGAR